MHLQGIQSFTEACIRLELSVQRDILLRNLNHLCISLDDSDILSDDGSTTSGVYVLIPPQETPFPPFNKLYAYHASNA